METGTKFNLAKSVQDWKLELFQSSNLTSDNINELESHLLDELDALKSKGLNNEEAFIISRKRIGNTDNISIEFGKVNKKICFSNMVLPYLNGILLAIMFLTIAELTRNTSVLIAKLSGVNDIYLNWISIVLFVLLTSVMFGLFYMKFKNHIINLKSLRNTPTLVITILIGKLLAFLSKNYIAQSFDVHYFGSLELSLSIYKLILLGFLLSISCIVYYFAKKSDRLQLAD